MGSVDQTCNRCGKDFYGPVEDGRCKDCTSATEGTRKDGR